MRSAFLTLLGDLQPSSAPAEDSSPAAAAPRVVIEPEAEAPPISRGGSQDSFAGEQVRRLVHQVFLQDFPRMPKQIVFSAVDPETDVDGICMQVGQVLSAQSLSTVALVQVGSQGDSAGDPASVRSPITFPPRNGCSFRLPDYKISANLWSIPSRCFCEKRTRAGSPGWLRERLAELEVEFDYTVIQASAASASAEVVRLGQICDGVVLVLEAHLTRRVVAQRVKEMLQAANVRLLGVVLSGRTFPIPERIYRRL